MKLKVTFPWNWAGSNISETRRCQSCGDVVKIIEMHDDDKICYICAIDERIRKYGQRIALENASDCEI